ncbi:MAG: GNAT family N-acetyltransferase [Thomasclavelia sp.]
MEDLYIKPEHRGKGYGKALFKQLAKIAVERKCGRLEWWCLDWNQPSIDFYLSLGAKAMKDWTVYRITGRNVKRIRKIKKLLDVVFLCMFDTIFFFSCFSIVETIKCSN